MNQEVTITLTENEIKEAVKHYCLSKTILKDYDVDLSEIVFVEDGTTDTIEDSVGIVVTVLEDK